MKKFSKLIALMLMMLCTFMFTACSAESEQPEESQSIAQQPEIPALREPGEEDMSFETDQPVMTDEAVNYDNIFDFVTLGQYVGVVFESIKPASVTEADVESRLGSFLNQFAVRESITDRPVEPGDIVTIDYEGFHDGVAFQGGTAQGQDLHIGSGQFIPGFEEQIVGHSIGDEFDIHVSFPEVYHSQELAGQSVVFRIKIHAISVMVVPELNDDFASLNFGVDSVELLRESIAQELLSEREINAENNARGQVWNEIMTNASIHKLNEEEVEFKITMQMMELFYTAMMNGMELEELISAMTGMPLDVFLEWEVRPRAIMEVKQDLVIRAIAVSQEIQISEREFDDFVDEMSQRMGISSQELLDMYGEETVRIDLLAPKVIERVMESAVAG